MYKKTIKTGVVVAAGVVAVGLLGTGVAAAEPHGGGGAPHGNGDHDGGRGGDHGNWDHGGDRNGDHGNRDRGGDHDNWDHGGDRDHRGDRGPGAVPWWCFNTGSAGYICLPLG